MHVAAQESRAGRSDGAQFGKFCAVGASGYDSAQGAIECAIDALLKLLDCPTGP